MTTVHEGEVCQTILDLYNKNAIFLEPSGALTTTVLDQYAEEIKEWAMLHTGHKHYLS